MLKSHRSLTRYCAAQDCGMTTRQQGQQPDITILFKDPTLWTGGIATHLLDQIYIQQLSAA